MTHALMATSLWRAASAIEALCDYLDPKIAVVLRPLVASINAVGDWHAAQNAGNKKRRAA